MSTTLFWRKMTTTTKTTSNLKPHHFRCGFPFQNENIHGKIVFVGAEDDVLWDTCKFIRRMDQRLKSMPHDSTYDLLLYEHGTHFVFPEGMLKIMFPVGSGLLVKLMFRAGKQFPKECKAARIDIDRKLSRVIETWQKKC